MKSILMLLILCLLHFNCIAQDDLYYTPAKKALQGDTTSIDQSVVIKYNLGKYYKERQVAWAFYGSSILLSGVGMIFLDQELEASKYFFIASAASAIISTTIFFDSDKWLNKAYLGVYPTGLRITF